MLINVAFITLLERKILGFSQLRLGPNKPRIYGLAQPGADAIKLFSNQFILLISSNLLYKLSPAISLSIILITWTTINFHQSSMGFEFGVLFFLIILRISIYPLMLMGWGAKNKYTLIGSVRGVAQTISYEISLIFIVLSFLFIFKIISIKQLTSGRKNEIYIFPILLGLWITVILAETNRTPFDFAEGERELVSGFNTEFRSRKFAIIFITEYAAIYLFSFFTEKISIFRFLLLIVFWIWIRATLPRYRYDILMNLNWKILLPISMIIPIWTLIYNKILLINCKTVAGCRPDFLDNYAPA